MLKAFLRIAAIAAVMAPELALAYDFTVPSGTSRQVWYSVSLNQDCTLMGDDVIRITAEPTHGRTTIKKASVHPNYPAANPRNVCNTRSYKANTIWYTPEAGFVGDDFISVDAISAGGAERTLTINIHVK